MALPTIAEKDEMIPTLTYIQQQVVEARLKDGYEFIGMYKNFGGLSGLDIGLVKGKHRVHINVIGYDSYFKGYTYVEVK